MVLVFAVGSLLAILYVSVKKYNRRGKDSADVDKTGEKKKVGPRTDLVPDWMCVPSLQLQQDRISRAGCADTPSTVMFSITARLRSFEDEACRRR